MGTVGTGWRSRTQGHSYYMCMYITLHKCHSNTITSLATHAQIARRILKQSPLPTSWKSYRYNGYVDVPCLLARKDGRLHRRFVRSCSLRGGQYKNGLQQRCMQVRAFTGGKLVRVFLGHTPKEKSVPWDSSAAALGRAWALGAAWSCLRLNNSISALDSLLGLAAWGNLGLGQCGGTQGATRSARMQVCRVMLA